MRSVLRRHVRHSISLPPSPLRAARKMLTLMLPLLLLVPSIVLAQGKLRGSVRDSVTGDPLIGANVYLLGTALGGVTDREGVFQVSAIPEGNYRVRVSYVGYKTKERSVTIARDTPVQLEFRMLPDVLEGEEIVILAQARGQTAAINQQLNAPTIINVVSEEKIQELPDANAAESIGRLPGVSLLRSGGEANKVILRGLSAKFTTVTIDGVRIPPTDADARGVDMSTLSQGSLAGIELYKALTPDRDADAIAGSVNLVTRKAPSERLLRFDLRGNYNNLMKSVNQYNFGARYGERFFNDILGVQVTGNLERVIRSNEQNSTTYKDNIQVVPHFYNIANFRLQFVDEVRKREGAGVLFDLNTPDNGSIRLHTNYSGTDRDYTVFTRNYPTLDADATQVLYQARNQEQSVKTFNASLRGENTLLGMGLTWGASFAQSRTENPFDFYINYRESNGLRDSVTGKLTSGMDIPPNLHISSDPGQIIPYAVNNFLAASMDSGIFRTEMNLDKEKTAYLDIAGKYTLGLSLSGEANVGGRYRYKDRFKEASRLFSPYYLGFAWQAKDLSGTRFDGFYKRYLTNTLIRNPALTDFLDPTPETRDIFDKYSLNPLMNKDAVHDWYQLNKNGTAAAPEYYWDNTADLDYYDIVERVGGVYLMNTLNYGQALTLMAGVRMESESNDYLSRYVPGAGSLGGFPTPTGRVNDTTYQYSENIWLPNVQLVVRPTDFLNVRLAAYRALARPDYNYRLIKLYAQAIGTVNDLFVGNPNMRTAKAWNYEVNTSIFSSTIGLVSVSAFYKEITDDLHMLEQAGFTSSTFIDSLLGSHWNTSLTSGGYQLTMPYNSTKPTRLWGFEFEHQANLTFLPGFLQYFVLSYNLSFVRSQTHLVATKIDTIRIWQPPPDPDTPGFWRYDYVNRVVDRVQKLESQPEFFGNVALGYDYKGFSARLSLFFQGEYNSSFSPDGRSDRIAGNFAKWDLTVRQRITDNFSVYLSGNNLLDVYEDAYGMNRVENWRRLSTSSRYGTTVDVGFRVDL